MGFSIVLWRGLHRHHLRWNWTESVEAMMRITAGSIICFLAFLSVIRTQDVANSPDLAKAYLQSIPSADDSKSVLLAKSSENDDEDPAPEEAIGQANIRRSGVPSSEDTDDEAKDDSDPQNRSDEDRSGGSAHAQAHAEASSGNRNEQPGYNPYYPGSIYPSSPLGSGSSSASAQAHAVSSGGSLNGQGLSPNAPGYLYPPSYGSGSNSALAQAIADASSGAGIPRSQGFNPYSVYPSPYGSGSNTAQAQAQAEASSGGSNGINPYSPGYPYQPSPYGSGSNSASAQALAEALSGAGSHNGQRLSPYSPGSLYPGSPYDLGSSSASAQAQADASNGGRTYGINPGSSQYSPESLYQGYPYDSGSSSASAQALADVSNGGSPRGQGYDLGLNPYLPGTLYPVSPGSGSSSAQAQAEAISRGELGGQGYNPGLSPLLPGYQNPASPYDSGSSSASAQAQADATSGGVNYPSLSDKSGLPAPNPVENPAEAPSDDRTFNHGLNQFPSLVPGYDVYPGSNAYADANAQALTRGQSHAQAIAHAASTGNLNHRPIGHHEYIIPHNIPGGEVVPRCLRPGELQYIWTNTDCFVCACVTFGSPGLKLVCASCSGCVNPGPPPPPEPTPYPVTIAPPPPPTSRPHTPPTLPPPPPPQVTCSPLPSGVPFQNPLHPCQICICTESVTVYGQPDVQIECQENPQCVVPPDVTTLPPFPDDKPKPLPLCKKFPQNVLFPYPADPCRLCKCSVSLSDRGIPEEQISCYPNPACEPQPFTLPSSTYNPITEPYIISTPHPVTTPAPPAPGPLPGPSPHESCRPYQPNQPFQHPWDECQLCVCTESYSVGLITIEVNCYNKKSCCVDLDPGYIGSAESQALAIAQSSSQNYPSEQNNRPEYGIRPHGNQGGLVPEPVPVGHRHRPGDGHLDDIIGQQGYRPEGSQSIANAIASAQSQVNQPSIYGGQEYIGPQGHVHWPGDNHPEHGLGPQGNQIRPGQSTAEAIALAQSQLYQGIGNSQPGQVIAPYGDQLRPGGNLRPQERPGGPIVPQFLPGGQGQYQVPGISAADAEAQASLLSGYNVNQPRYYQGYKLLGHNSPSTYGSGYYNYPSYYPGYPGNIGSPEYKSNAASANANGGGSSANAEALASSQGYGQADASANAQSGASNGLYNDYQPQGYGGYNSAGIPSPRIYSNLYSRPGYEANPLYQPVRAPGASSSALAQALGGSNALAQASAVSGVRNKSGYPEDETDEQDEKIR